MVITLTSKEVLEIVEKYVDDNKLIPNGLDFDIELFRVNGNEKAKIEITTKLKEVQKDD